MEVMEEEIKKLKERAGLHGVLIAILIGGMIGNMLGGPVGMFIYWWTK